MRQVRHVAGEQLVRTLTVEHDLQSPVRRHAEDTVLGVDAGASERFVLRPNQPFQVMTQIIVSNLNLMNSRAGIGGGKVNPAFFVDAWSVGDEADRLQVDVGTTDGTDAGDNCR